MKNPPKRGRVVAEIYNNSNFDELIGLTYRWDNGDERVAWMVDFSTLKRAVIVRLDNLPPLEQV